MMYLETQRNVLNWLKMSLFLLYRFWSIETWSTFNGSVGSLGKLVDETNVNGITVTNCTLVKTKNGARIRSYHDSPKIEATNIVFEHLVMEGVQNPILIDQHYNSKDNSQVIIKIIIICDMFQNPSYFLWCFSFLFFSCVVAIKR